MTNTTTNETSKYTGLWNKHGQCVVVPAATAHLPHVRVTWYSFGMWASGHTYVAEGETDAQAAERAFGTRFDRETLEVVREELSPNYPR